MSATSVLCPTFWLLWEILSSPIRVILGLAGGLAFICAQIVECIGNAWRTVSSVFRVASASEATLKASEVSLWRSLWNDLFSQVCIQCITDMVIGYLVNGCHC